MPKSRGEIQKKSLGKENESTTQSISKLLIIMTDKRANKIIGLILYVSILILYIIGITSQEDTIDINEMEFALYDIVENIEILFSLFIWGYMIPIIPLLSISIAIYICPNNKLKDIIGGTVISLILTTMMLIFALALDYCITTLICFEFVNIIFLSCCIYDLKHSNSSKQQIK